MVCGVIIPDRGDRSEFLSHLFSMLEGQTRKPDFIELVNYAPISKAFDLTARVKAGFEALKTKGCDVVLIMENDDFYSSDYIETMLFLWELYGEPDLFGTNSTIYYHLKKKEFRVLKHEGRASLMNSMIKTSAELTWPNDEEVYLDLYLWKQMKGISVSINRVICLGIKHGIGLCGGNGHDSMRYDQNDQSSLYLKSNVDEKSFEFYSRIQKKLK